MGKCSVNDDFIRLQAVSDSTVSGAFHPFLKTRILFFLGTLSFRLKNFIVYFLLCRSGGTVTFLLGCMHLCSVAQLCPTL